VPDAALFVAALSDRRELLIERPQPGTPRVGLCRTHEWNRAGPETIAMFEDAGGRLRKAGASVRDIMLPPQFAGLADAQLAVMVREVAQSLSHEWHSHRDGLSGEMVAMIEAGLAVSAERYDAARTLARQSRAALTSVFADIDVVLAPSTAGEAPEGIRATGDPLFNRMWTLLRTPCIHLPLGLGPRGLPVGVTIAGPIGADRSTLLAADWSHNATLQTVLLNAVQAYYQLYAAQEAVASVLAAAGVGAGSAVAWFFAPALLPASGPVAGIWFSVIVGWTWLTLTTVYLYRAAPT
jgi:amidase